MAKKLPLWSCICVDRCSFSSMKGSNAAWYGSKNNIYIILGIIVFKSQFNSPPHPKNVCLCLENIILGLFLSM